MPPQRKFKATIFSIEDYDNKVKRFLLVPDIPLPRFKNGQFLHLAIDEYDPSTNWPDSRAFSIASSGRDTYLEIIVSKKGDFTKRVFSELKPGMNVWIRMPFGEFNLDDLNGPLVLIAGGTGISPFIPFLKNLDQYQNVEAHLFYGVFNEDLLIIDDLIKALNEKNNFHLNLFIEESSSFTELGFEKGKINIIKAIELAINKIAKIYISGPPVLIENSIKVCKEKGLSENSIFYDEWQ